MDGSFSGLEKGIGDMFSSTVNAAKKTATDTARASVAQVTGSAPAEPSSEEGSALEANTTVSPQAQHTNNASPSSPANIQSPEEQQKLATIRKELQSRHMKTYFIPTFEQKPKQIAKEREQKWLESQKQEEQEKQQMEYMETEKKKEYEQIALDKKAKGEIGKAGGG